MIDTLTARTTRLRDLAQHEGRAGRALEASLLQALATFHELEGRSEGAAGHQLRVHVEDALRKRGISLP